MSELRLAVQRLQAWFDRQGFRSDGQIWLHKYDLGKHQADCPWCAVTEAMTLEEKP